MNTNIHVVHLISSLRVGGAEALLVDLIQELKASECRNTVIFFHDGPHRLRLQALGVETIHIVGLICLYDPIFWVRLLLKIRVLYPDVIHASLWSANVCARILRVILNIPVVCAIHSRTNRAHAQTTDGLVRSLIDRILSSGADRYVYVAPGMHACYVPAAKSVTIINGVAVVPPQSRAEVCTFFKVPQQAFVVGTVGRFSPAKNHELLIRSGAKLNHNFSRVHLVLVGQGAYELRLYAEIARLGIERSVQLIDCDVMADKYLLFDCFVMTSFQEGLSIALLEAMAAGVVPVVVAPGMKHDVVVHEYNGLLVPEFSDDALCRTIERLLLDHSFRTRLGAQAQQTVREHFTVQRMAQEYIQVYREIRSSEKKCG